MTKVSRRYLNKELENRIIEVFLKTIVDIKTTVEAKNFIEDLLSPTERIMLVKRLAIFRAIAGEIVLTSMWVNPGDAP